MMRIEPWACAHKAGALPRIYMPTYSLKSLSANMAAQMENSTSDFTLQVIARRQAHLGRFKITFRLCVEAEYMKHKWMSYVEFSPVLMISHYAHAAIPNPTSKTWNLKHFWCQTFCMRVIQPMANYFWFCIRLKKIVLKGCKDDSIGSQLQHSCKKSGLVGRMRVQLQHCRVGRD